MYLIVNLQSRKREDMESFRKICLRERVQKRKGVRNPDDTALL